ISFGGDDFERVKYLTPPDLRGRIFAAVADFVARLAAAQPVVLVFEDLHWADPTSLDLIEQLMPLTEQTSLLLLALFRPQRQEPSWRFHEVAARAHAHRYTAIQLEPLDEPHARELVANLLHIEDLPEKVRALILQKAEGNPFFVEEVIRSLLDAKLVVRDNGHWRATREIENIAVPDTLAGVITARLDRLDEHAKRAAQTASVIGRDFQYDMLGDVYDPRDKLDGALSDLQRRELVREKSRLPQRAYLFKHALTQETAYASLLLSRRRELHRRVAECLERVAPERVNDIARHLLDAQERTRALPYVLTAGDRASKAYATREAIGYYTQALQILETAPDTQAARRAYEGLGGALTLANDAARAVEAYQQMLALGQARDDVPMQISAFNKLGFVVGMRMGQFSEAEKYLTEAEQLARAFQDKPGLSEMFTFRCMMCTAVADFNGVVQYMGETVSLGRELNVKEQMAMGLDHIASTLVYMTRFDEAWQAAQEALQLTRAIGNREHEAAVLATAMTFCHIRNGDWDAARETATQGTQIAAEIGALFPHVYGEWALGEIARARGEYETALQHLQCAWDVARPVESYMPFMVVMPMATLGATYFDISAQLNERVADLHARVTKMFAHPAAMMSGASVWADLGFNLLAVGQIDEASEMFQKGLSAPTMMMLLMKPRFLMGLALAAVAQRRLDDARQLADEASAFVVERKMRNWYPSVALADAQVSAARGEWERALESYARAESDALAMQLRPAVWQARVGAAQLLAAQGRAAEAEAQSQGARAMADEIAGLFTDGELRAQFAEKVRRAVGSQQRTVNGER
ncbi:MAG: AAA family ATPase, partial [Chloroflexota bacterium]